MAKDYYAVLEVTRKASEKEIKDSFRRLARKYHPDLNPNDKGAEAKFKELNEAHEVLGDPEKRKLYDSYGSNWEAASQGGGGGFQDMTGDFGDIFGQIFQNFGQTVQQPQAKRQVPPRDVEKVVEVTLKEIDTGTKRTLTYQVPDVCKSCDGGGSVKLRSARACSKCGGSGQTRGAFGFAGPCDECGGTGQTTREKCPSCGGSGTIATTKKVEVTIPVGISDGKKLRVPGRGGLGSNGRAGDLYVIIKETPTEGFTRRGEDLETELGLPFTKAALGGEISVPTLRGSVSMRIPELTQTGQVFRLADQGISTMKGKRGNLLVRIKIVMPKAISAEQKKLIESLAKLEESK